MEGAVADGRGFAGAVGVVREVRPEVVHHVDACKLRCLVHPQPAVVRQGRKDGIGQRGCQGGADGDACGVGEGREGEG